MSFVNGYCHKLYNSRNVCNHLVFYFHKFYSGLKMKLESIGTK